MSGIWVTVVVRNKLWEVYYTEHAARIVFSELQIEQ
jgi:hypothetical protein